MKPSPRSITDPGKESAHEAPLSSSKSEIIRPSPRERLDTFRHSVRNVESAIVHKCTEAEISHDELAHQITVARQLSVPVRVTGVLMAVLAVICTWEALDHLIVYLFPKSRVQILAYCIILLAGLVTITVSKTLTTNDWNTLGSFGFTIGSLCAMISTWGLVKAAVRIYTPESSRLGVWAIGSLLSLAGSLAYMGMTHHNALLDIASCANSLGYFDDADIEAHPDSRVNSESRLRTEGGAGSGNYSACS